jgi:hypothetical protein
VLLRKKLAVLLAATMTMVMLGASPAFAFHCANVAKKPGAGTTGTFNADTGEFTPTKEKGGGGFITVTGTSEDGSTFSYDVFAHGVRPDGAMAAGPEGDSECDGVGIDDALACEGVDEE